MEHEINRVIARRSITVLGVFIVAWLILCVRLFVLQIVDYEEYRQKVIDSVQRTSEVSAERGIVYDRNMKILATNTNVWRVFISPVDIEDDAQAVVISNGLSTILDVSYDDIYKRAKKENRADETIKKNVDKDTADRVRAFILENKLSKQIHLEATTMRYYPYDNLASSVVGFTGTDGGSYGIELKYDSSLQGIPGRYVTAKNGLGMDMSFKYESYIEAQNGYNVVSTLDMTIQMSLEKQLENARIDGGALDGTCGIVLDVQTGAILAMADMPDFNLNRPGLLNDSLLGQLTEYESGSDEYKEKYNELMFSTWNNKCVSWLYEPGSTFKIITASMALEEDICTLNDKFTCSGKTFVEGYSKAIYCHKTTGHGTLDFAGALQQSCNPALVEISRRVGKYIFWDYFNAFGYTSRTGVDLPGEAYALYASLEQINQVELAVYGFGQTFKITPLQQITAISAIANGGNLVTPHIMERIVDNNGTVISEYGTAVKRQVVSEEVCDTITDILEKGVSGNGAAKNAYIAGYKIAAKTGTSQIRDILDESGNSYLHIGSCIAYAPADDPKIAALIIVDKPQNGNIYGSIVAAPYLTNLLEEILPYLGIERSYSEEETARMQVNVWDYTGFSVEKTVLNITNQGLAYEIIGDGNTVLSQTPKAGSQLLKSTGKILFYTTTATPSEYVTVPDVIGYSATVANNKLVSAGLNVCVEGSLNYDSGAGAKTVAQSVEGGSKVLRGTVVKVEFRHMDGTD